MSDTPVAHGIQPSRRRKSPAQRAKDAQTRDRLLQATAATVQEVGFEKTSVAAITARAEVAHGAFYLHFKSRQDVFDQLLTTMGAELVACISAAIRDSKDLVDIERRGLEANLAFSDTHPYMHRVMSEAELFAPVSYRAFMAELRDRYVRSLQRSMRAGALPGFRDSDLDTLAVLLMGMRRALIHAYAMDGQTPKRPARSVVRTYLKVVTAGLMGHAERPAKTASKAGRKT